MTHDASICVLGLPGLYQNWLIGALDVHSRTEQHAQHNFVTFSSSVKWLKKNELDFSQELAYDHVINLYVKNKNFVWYLYNFLEKTDGVGIMVQNLHTDLFSKANGTVAFDGMLKHFVQAYGVSSHTPVDDIKNSLIEYFYFVLIQDQSAFRQRAHLIMPDAINIEYGDFSFEQKLLDLLSCLPNLHKQHFVDRYQQLQKRNSKYLNLKSRFPDNFVSRSLDHLTTAYIGALITTHTGDTLDWFNPEVRQKNIDKHAENIVKWHDT